MNYFDEIGDPYHSFVNYYQAVRKILDDNGLQNVEVGSGESSIQWAPSSDALTIPPPTSMEGFDNEKSPMSEMKQAYRMNFCMGNFYNMGGTKYMWWGEEFTPGIGWPWRWGFRKFEDHWGAYPDDYKIPGTKIVFKHEGDPDAKPPIKPCDLRAAWVRPTDPYHPMWETFKFWAQASLPGSEAMRVPMTLESPQAKLYSLATFQMSNNAVVALVQNDTQTLSAITAKIDLTKTGWAKGSALKVDAMNEDINYATGIHTRNWEKALDTKVDGGMLTMEIPQVKGWTTVKITPADGSMNAEYLQQVLPQAIPVGRSAEGRVIVRNSGTADWKAGNVKMALYPKPGDARKLPRKSWKLEADAAAGQNASIAIVFPGQEKVGYATYYYRLRDKSGNWFGPVMSISGTIVDNDAPRKLVAHREMDHVRLKWFAPENGLPVKQYRIFRAEGFQKPFKKLTTVKDATEFLDKSGEKDQAYYYNVKAVYADGHVSNASNDDNARALSKPRIWDAEIVSHTIPAMVKMGEFTTVTVTVKNTGQRAWNLADKEMYFGFKNTQCWGTNEDGKLPDMALGETGTVEPGQTVTVNVSYAAPKTGRFENHWIMVMDVKGRKERIMFGTPLLWETAVK